MFRLPETLKNGLAQLPAERVAEVAERWANGEEMAHNQVSAIDLEPLVIQLQAFAGRAVAENKQLLLWMSL